MLRLMFPFMVFSAKIKGPSTWLYGSPCHIHFSSIVVINLEALFYMFVEIVLNSSHVLTAFKYVAVLLWSKVCMCCWNERFFINILQQTPWLHVFK